MSPASKSKSKSKDKSAARAVKEQKVSPKASGSSSSTSGCPSNAYNPLSGTFHTVDTLPHGSSPTHHNSGRFRNVDDRSDYSGSSHETVSEYDSLSTNDSCSGESEDPKGKAANVILKQEAVPSCDSERREKIRQKNERKHQRQKERRAQELHDRCCGYLMSRKLEALTQKLVAMGFPSDRATLALIVNEGRLEESVSWLFGAGEQETQSKDAKVGSDGNLKIDISAELAQITELEVKYKSSKQDVERAVIACEGNLEKAEDTLKEQKQEQLATSTKSEEALKTNSQIRPQEKPTPPVTIPQMRNERDLDFAKLEGTMSVHFGPGNRNTQLLKMSQPKTIDKRWPDTGSSPPVSYSLASPMQLAPLSAKMEAQSSFRRSEGGILAQVSVREPIVMMQRPQSTNARQKPVLNVPPPDHGGWYPNTIPSVDIAKSSNNLLQNQRIRLCHESISSHQPCNQQYSLSSPMDTPASRLEGSWSRMGASSPSLAVPASLGLYSGWGSTGALGSLSPVNWNSGGSMPECDYRNIDWTLEANSSSKANGLWMDFSPPLKSKTGVGLASNHRLGVPHLQNRGIAVESPSAAAYEWTSPFAGSDIFSVPRQYVTSSL